MELQDWRKEPRKNYSNEFKLRMVELEILGASLVLKRPLPYQNWGMLQGLTCSSRIVAELAMKK